MMMRNAEGTIIGSVMPKVCRQKPAPSSRAYSYSGSGMACSAAMKMTTAKPRFFHTKSRMMGTRSSAPCSQMTRARPSPLSMRLTTPP